MGETSEHGESNGGRVSMGETNLARVAHGTPHSGYGTTPVGCRGGNRYVEGEPRTFG